jgi:hypothetical protein
MSFEPKLGLRLLGFYFAGRHKSLEIGREEFILDLLFYHHPTRRFVVRRGLRPVSSPIARLLRSARLTNWTRRG